MIIKTYQHPKVLETLLKGETYVASFENTNYIDKYRYLSDMLYKNDTICPIFGYCEDISNRITTYGAKITDGVLLVLDVPENECNFMEYYEWTDFMYFSDYADKDDYKLMYDSDEITQEQYNDLMYRIINGWKNEEPKFSYNQTVIRCIRPEWLKDYEIYYKGFSH